MIGELEFIKLACSRAKYALRLLQSGYRMGNRRNFVDRGLGHKYEPEQGMAHLIKEVDILFLVHCSVLEALLETVRTRENFSSPAMLQ